MNKDYEKQEKRIKELKSHGQSKKQAVSLLFAAFSELSLKDLLCIAMAFQPVLF
jgi:hypothetical protein